MIFQQLKGSVQIVRHASDGSRTAWRTFRTTLKAKFQPFQEHFPSRQRKSFRQHHARCQEEGQWRLHRGEICVKCFCSSDNECCESSRRSRVSSSTKQNEDFQKRCHNFCESSKKKNTKREHFCHSLWFFQRRFSFEVQPFIEVLDDDDDKASDENNNSVTENHQNQDKKTLTWETTVTVEV